MKKLEKEKEQLEKERRLTNKKGGNKEAQEERMR